MIDLMIENKQGLITTAIRWLLTGLIVYWRWPSRFVFGFMLGGELVNSMVLLTKWLERYSKSLEHSA